MRTVDALAAATPPTRDRYVDLLRAASICAVVFGHWFIGVIHVEHGLAYLTSAVGLTSGLWLGTWFFQVMPVFFFVGGFSNLTAYDAFRRRGESAGAFVRSRAARLLRPSLVFLGIWAAVQVVLHVAHVGRPAGPDLWNDTTLLRGMLPPAQTLPFGPLWFLGFYLVVVTAAPALIALHRRFGLAVPIAMATMVVVVDVVGFGLGLRQFRYLNVAPVLLFPHQLGFFYAEGRAGSRRLHAAMAVGGLLGLVLLTTPWVFQLFGDARFEWFPGLGQYPKSLLGTDVERISNAYPPTVCFLLGAVWSVGAVMLLRPAITRWLERPRAWKATIAANAVIMSLFLWHMTAYLLAILALWPLGIGRESDSTARWWAERPIWILVPGLILAAIVALMARFERPARRPPGGRTLVPR
ncbi:MAG: acyltransferase family protein [Actinomycetota bacterium]